MGSIMRDNWCLLTIHKFKPVSRKGKSFRGWGVRGGGGGGGGGGARGLEDNARRLGGGAGGARGGGGGGCLFHAA